MHAETHCRRLASWLTTQGLRATVALRLPKASKADLVVWPYLTDTDPAARNAVARRDAEGRPVPPVMPGRTHVLLLPAALSAHDRAMALIHGNPLLADDVLPLRLSIESLSPTDLGTLFTAARAEYRLCLPLMID